MSKKIIKEFTQEEVSETIKSLEYISSFVGVATSLALDSEDDKCCDLYTLGQLAKEKIRPLMDVFILLKHEAEKKHPQPGILQTR